MAIKATWFSNWLYIRFEKDNGGRHNFQYVGQVNGAIVGLTKVEISNLLDSEEKGSEKWV